MAAQYPNSHPIGCPWHAAAETWGASNLKWCEETICHIISEPANTWSNLSYMIAAVFMWRMVSKRKNQVAPRIGYKWLSVSMFLMGAFSFFYHMSNFFLSQMLDFLGMYLFLLWSVCLNLDEFLQGKKVRTIGIVYVSLLLLFMVSTVIAYRVGFHFQYFIVLVGAILIGSEVLVFLGNKLSLDQYRTFFLGVGFIAVAQTFSFMDLTRVYCAPFLPGHAVWHIFSAIGLYLVSKHQFFRPTSRYI
jgi:hypothetical protein